MNAHKRAHASKILRALSVSKQLERQALCEFLNISLGSLRETLSALATQGMIEVSYSITKEGRQALDGVKHYSPRVPSVGLSPEDIQQLKQLNLESKRERKREQNRRQREKLRQQRQEQQAQLKRELEQSALSEPDAEDTSTLSSEQAELQRRIDLEELREKAKLNSPFGLAVK